MIRRNLWIPMLCTVAIFSGCLRNQGRRIRYYPEENQQYEQPREEESAVRLPSVALDDIAPTAVQADFVPHQYRSENRNCYPNCRMPSRSRNRWGIRRAHRAKTVETLARDRKYIRAAMMYAAVTWRCHDVRLIKDAAMPAQNGLWQQYNQLWHRVYHLNVCGTEKVLKWIGTIGTTHKFRDETRYWRDGYIPEK